MENISNFHFHCRSAKCGSKSVYMTNPSSTVISRVLFSIFFFLFFVFPFFNGRLSLVDLAWNSRGLAGTPGQLGNTQKGPDTALDFREQTNKQKQATTTTSLVAAPSL